MREKSDREIWEEHVREYGKKSYGERVQELIKEEEEKPWESEEYYDFDFRQDYCPGCNKWTTIGNWKVRERGVVKDIWLCNKCGDKLVKKIKKQWRLRRL